MSTPSDHAGESPLTPIPLSVPLLRGNEWRYVQECLETNWVSSAGPFVDRFERMVAEYVGAPHAVATVNGTAALHIALQLAGVRPDEEVLLPTLTFIATANAVRYTGAWPVFFDVEPHFWQLDPTLVDDFCRQACTWRSGKLINRATGRRIAALVPVHLLGHPAAMDDLLDVARRYQLPVVEDAAESLGALYQGRQTGTFGLLGCYSFNGNKTITTGGGGMIVTSDPQLAQRARYLTTTAKNDAVEHIHGEVGYNYRLPNVLAAIGCGQLETLDDCLATKRRLAARYQAAFEQVPGVSMFRASPQTWCTYWLSTIQIDEAQLGGDRRALLQHLREQRIETRPLWQPLHLSPAHRGAWAVNRGVAERLVAGGLSLPSSVGLGDADQQRVIAAVAQFATGRMGRGPQSRTQAA